MRTYRNREWELEVWVSVLMLALTVSLLWGVVGWYRYRDERAVKEDLERLLGNMYEPLD